MLRFMCKPGEQTPEIAAANAHGFLRRPQGKYQCAPITSIRLDGNEAIFALQLRMGWVVSVDREYLAAARMQHLPGRTSAGPTTTTYLSTMGTSRCCRIVVQDGPYSKRQLNER